MRNWSDNWYTKETDQKYMDAAIVNDLDLYFEDETKVGSI